MSRNGPSRRGLLAELRRRKVFRVAAVYTVVAWAVIEVADTVLPRLALPDWTVTFVIALAILGFPVALVLAWALEVTQEGVKRTEAADTGRTPAGGRARAAAWAAIGMLVAFVGFGAYVYLGPEHPLAGPESATAPTPPSVAVLPFANMSGSSENEYFSDGITEELLNALVAIPALRVPARTSSFAFKGRNLPIRDIARQLDVAHVVEGSVRRDGDRVRITAQLIDARTDAHLWSETYDRELRDIFRVQEEISRAIADVLEVTIMGASRPIVREGTSDPEAHTLYLKGRHAWNRRTAASLRTAIEYLESATARDPGYARAWSALADAYALLPDYAYEAVDPWSERAVAAAERAIALDPSLAEPHATVATIHELRKEVKEAERAFQRSFELNPNYATAYHWYSKHLELQGRFDESLRAIQRAQALDPLSPVIAVNVADALHVVGRHDEAVAEVRRLIEVEPDVALAHAWLAMILSYQERHGDAATAARRALELVGPDADARSLSAALAYALARAGEREEAARLTAGIEAAAERGVRGADYGAAMAYLALGDTARARAWAERAMRTGSGEIVLASPELEPLRHDPKLRRLLQEADIR